MKTELAVGRCAQNLSIDAISHRRRRLGQAHLLIFPSFGSVASPRRRGLSRVNSHTPTLRSFERWCQCTAQMSTGEPQQGGHCVPVHYEEEELTSGSGLPPQLTRYLLRFAGQEGHSEHALDQIEHDLPSG